jgi:hypothetical protein
MEEVLEFVRKQASEDRNNHERLVKYFLLFIGFATALAVYLIGRSVEDIRASVRAAVETRITDEFKTENIRKLISEATDRIIGSNEFRSLVKNETAKRVSDEVLKQEAFIQNRIKVETNQQISSSSCRARHTQQRRTCRRTSHRWSKRSSPSRSLISITSLQRLAVTLLQETCCGYTTQLFTRGGPHLCQRPREQCIHRTGTDFQRRCNFPVLQAA